MRIAFLAAALLAAPLALSAPAAPAVAQSADAALAAALAHERRAEISATRPRRSPSSRCARA